MRLDSRSTQARTRRTNRSGIGRDCLANYLGFQVYHTTSPSNGILIKATGYDGGRASREEAMLDFSARGINIPILKGVATICGEQELSGPNDTTCLDKL
jgi:hypothetical protein